MSKRLWLISSCLLVSSILAAQSSPSGERGGVVVWVGGSYSSFNPDYGCSGSSPFSCSGGLLQGISTFADVNHIFLSRLGVEGKGTFLHWGGPPGLSEDSYLVGPRFNVWRFRRNLLLDAKLLVGSGHINLPNHGTGEGSYFVYSPGVGADFRLSPRWAARVEYEYQVWPGFTGEATSFTTGTGGIRPNGFSAGVSYAVFR